MHEGWVLRGVDVRSRSLWCTPQFRFRRLKKGGCIWFCGFSRLDAEAIQSSHPTTEILPFLELVIRMRPDSCRLRDLRLRAGLTQAQLANRLGVSRSMIHVV